MDLHRGRGFSEPLRALAWACGVVLLVALTVTVWGKEKIKVEELVARHLESIGTAEAREGVENILATGKGSVIPKRGGAGRIDGAARVVSEPDTTLVYVKFGNPGYDYEALLFDGEDTDFGQMQPGQRSPLGSLVQSQDLILKEGLIGGALTLDWPFHHIDEKNPKLNYKGVKKRDGERHHEVEYRARKGRTDFRIRLYFDEETFRHVESDYRLTISARMGADPRSSSQQQETRYRLVERFSDFRQENGLTLPHRYLISYTRQSQSTLEVDWEIQLDDFQFNQSLEGAYKIHN
ncbi:MAG TPA: hypothetical protein VLV83_09345 [Acidobacteriota bacterium]|nr:hypothetical protein [Acidobacteriota bacterium]